MAKGSGQAQLDSAWATFRATVNSGWPNAANAYRALTRALGAVPSSPPVTPPPSGGGGTQPGNCGDLMAGRTAVGPTIIPNGDPLIAVARAAYALVDNTYGGTNVLHADPGCVPFQSTQRPSSAPGFAWGFTQRRPTRAWVNVGNPAEKPHDERYATLHEYAHTLDIRFLQQPDRDQIRAVMGAKSDWGQGTYTANGTNVPAEAYADAVARALSGNGFKPVLPGFFAHPVPVKQYAWLLTLIEKAMNR